MVAPVYNSGTKAIAQPKTVEAFEGMMRDLLKEAKNYKSPFVATKKEVITHNPAKNPFAPLYRPDKEVLYRMDRFHTNEPPRYLGKEANPKEKIFAAAGGSVPPPDKNPDIYNKITEKVLADNKNNLPSNDTSYLNKYKK